MLSGESMYLNRPIVVGASLKAGGKVSSESKNGSLFQVLNFPLTEIKFGTFEVWEE